MEKIQAFDPTKLGREAELGSALSFRSVVPQAKRLVELFRLIPPTAIEWLDRGRANELSVAITQTRDLFDRISSWNPVAPDATSARATLLHEIDNAYDNVYYSLVPTVAFGVALTANPTSIERTVDKAVSDMKSEVAELSSEVKQQLWAVSQALEAVRSTAGEEGVSKQAVHFENEAKSHASEAAGWWSLTILCTQGLALYAVATLFLHKIPLFAPTNSFETIQLAVSKVLVFSTLAYFLILSAKNFLAHRHNAIVNKHRQNALATYRALVEAAGDSANRDIVLTKAAECIFGAQPTGFGKAESGESGSISMVSLAPGAIKPSVGP